MKHVGYLLVVLFLLLSVAGAQQTRTKPLFGPHHLHRMASQTSATSGGTVSSSSNAQVNTDDVWQLGTYPGGTWLSTFHINDSGVVVGLGDVPPLGLDGVGYTHTLIVSLFGPHAGEWIDLGTLGGEQPKGWEEPFADISNTGLVVSHSTRPDGHVHGAAWTKETGMVDLGTLADTGDPLYGSYDASSAFSTNKLGTLIGGVSGPDANSGAAPVVWTQSNVWVNGKFVTKWKIHKLDTSAFPDLTGWAPWGVKRLWPDRWPGLQRRLLGYRSCAVEPPR